MSSTMDEDQKLLAPNRHNDQQHPDSYHDRSTTVSENMEPKLEMFGESCGPTSDEYKKYRMTPSRKLPRWIWYILAKSLGVKTHQNDKPWFGTIMYTLTLTTGCGYAITNTWYSLYDIISTVTKQTVFTGTTHILSGIFWVGLGIYANNLAGNLFGYPRFRDEAIRAHSKTIFGLSAVKVITLIAIGALALNSYEHSDYMSDQHCLSVNISVVLCKVMYITRVSFSVLAAFWNMLVASIMLSICRTHTVVLRRFIKELEKDGQLFEKAWIDRDTRDMFQSADIVTLPDGCMTKEGEFEWDNEIPSFPSNFGNDEDLQNSVNVCSSSSSTLVSVPRGSNYGSLEQRPSINDYEQEDLSNSSNITKQTLLKRHFSNTSQKSEGETSVADSTLPGQCQREVAMLSLNQILIGYWKMMALLRVSSLALQRWLFCTLLLLLVMAATYIIQWLNEPVNDVEVILFMMGIILLPLLCSPYAEVNYECSRVLPVICPINERLPLLRYLTVQPLAMTMYGFPLSYGTIVTAIAAIGLGFATKMVFDEFT